MSKKFDAFMIALEALCRKHDVCLTTSPDGELCVWDLTGEPRILPADTYDGTAGG